MVEATVTTFADIRKFTASLEVLDPSVVKGLGAYTIELCKTPEDISSLETEVRELWGEIHGSLDYEWLADLLLSIPNADYMMMEMDYCNSDELKAVKLFDHAVGVVRSMEESENIEEEDLLMALACGSWFSAHWPKITPEQADQREDASESEDFPKAVSDLVEASQQIYKYSHTLSEYGLIRDFRGFLNIVYKLPNIARIPHLQSILLSFLDKCLLSEGVKDVSEDEIFSAIRLQGFEQGEDARQVLVNEQALRAWLSLNIPLSFLRDIPSISCKEGKTETIGGLERLRVGAYSLSDGSIELHGNVVSTDKLSADDIKRLEDLLVKIEAGELTTQALENLSHEIGHHFHEKLFTLKDLADWQKVVEQERVRVSDYVSETAEHNHEDEAREDFAESFWMFVVGAYKLRQLAPLRFEYMKVLFEKYGKEQFKSRLLRTSLGKAYLADSGLGSE